MRNVVKNRLGHTEEAREAYGQCILLKFSLHAWKRLLDIYVAEWNIPKALEACVQIAWYHDRTYNETIYPTLITRHLCSLIREHGYSKVYNTLVSLPGLTEASQAIVAKYMNYAKTFNVKGHNV